MRETQNKTTISVRLSADEERSVRLLAKRKRRTVSDVIRDAVAGIVEVDRKMISRPYDEISDLIGSVAGLPPDLSEGGGDEFAAILREKAGLRK
jgi:Ribbon-helix-helix protein, copG family.